MELFKWNVFGNRPVSLVLALTAAIGLGGCEPVAEEPGSEGPQDGCSVVFTKSIQPVQINGGQHLYFSVDELEFLKNPKIQIEDIRLHASLRGKRKGDAADPLDISVNGITTSPRNGAKVYELLEYILLQDLSRGRFKLHQLQLNGAEPFRSFMAKVMKNKGELKFTLHGKKGVQLTAASLEFVGRDYSDCGGGNGGGQQPGPSPSPAVAPKTMIVATTPSGSDTSSTTMSIEFASDQANVNFTCALDGAAAESCTSPQVYSGLANGAHSFKVVATNSAGLSDAVGASHGWNVDTVPPSVNVSDITGVPSTTNSTSITLTFAGAESGVTYRCSLDGGAYQACSSPMSYENLLEGGHSISIVAVDAAGNVSENPAVVQWTVDLTAPVAMITQATPASTIHNSTSVELQFAASETATFECSRDGSAFSACASPLSLSGLAEGEHELVVRATDVAGNQGTTASYSWIVDLTAPQLILGNVSPAPGLTNSTNVSAEFWADEAVSFSCSWDGGSASECASPFEMLVTSEGTHTLVVKAVDLAGNAAAEASFGWTMDFTAPVLSFKEILPSAASFVNVRALSFSLASTDSVSAMNASLDGASLGAVVDSRIELSGLSEGSHQLIVTSRDEAGNVAASLTHDFSVDLTAPVVNLAAEISGVVQSTSNSFSFSAGEEASFECELNGAGFGPCQSPHAISGLADGQHVFKVKAVDRAGNASAIASHSWTVDNLAPVITLVGVQSGPNLVFTLASNEPGTTYVCAFNGGAHQPCTSPVTYSNLTQGDYTLNVRGTDVAGNTDLAGVTLTMFVDRTSPVVSGISSSVTRSTMTIRWTTSEGATSQVWYAAGSTSTPNRSTVETSSYVTSHQVQVSGLLNNTVYSVQVAGQDRFGNRYMSTKFTVRTAF